MNNKVFKGVAKEICLKRAEEKIFWFKLSAVWNSANVRDFAESKLSLWDSRESTS